MSEARDSRPDHEEGFRWDSVGRAAEDFARHVARDAARFAERIERHASDLAHDIGREWQRSARRERRREHGEERDDVKRVFEEVRLVIDDVLDGVDHMIARLFPDRGAAPEPPEPPVPPEKPHAAEQPWARMVTNRDATCSRCGAEIPVGDAAFARETAAGPELRCLGCGS